MEGSFARLPAESVQLCGENLGIHTSAEVSSAMADDTSFRIRQVTDAAIHFMHHAKRRRLTSEDFDKALKWSSVEPLYGTVAPPPSFLPAHHTGEVDLLEAALGSPLDGRGLPQPLSVSATWLAVEGVSVSGEGGEGGLLEPGSIEIKRPQIEAHEKYLSLLMEAVAGESEDLRRLALMDIQSNPSVANILPDLSQYLQETLFRWNQFTPEQLLRVLKLVLSLFRNPALFLDPYAPSLLQPVQAIVTSPAYLQTSDSFSHWHVRQLAAVTLCEIIRRSATPLNSFLSELHSLLGHLLSFQREASLPVLYGALLTLYHLGAQSIADVLFVHLEAVSGHVQSLLESADPVMKENALRVYETLLISAEILLTSSSSLQCPDVLRHSLPSRRLPLQQITAHPPSSSSSSFFASPAGSSSSSSGGGGGGGGGVGAKKSAMVGAMDAIGVVSREIEGDGKETPTLYDYLVDIFGERLSLRLASHDGYRPQAPAAEAGTNKSGGGGGVEERTSPKQHSGDDHALMDFLSQEGFRTARIQLPQKQAPPIRPHPPHYMGRPLYSFPIPASCLPVQSNVLDLRPHTRCAPKAAAANAVVKGKAMGHRTSVAKTTRTVHPDLASSWI